MLALSDVIDPAKLSGDKVVFGATVKLDDTDSGDEVVYSIVGEQEADIKKGLISITRAGGARAHRPRGRRHRARCARPRASASTRSSKSPSKSSQ